MAAALPHDAAVPTHRSAGSTYRTWRVLGRAAIYLALLAGALWFLLPLLWMITSSFKSKMEIYRYPPVLLPWPPRWQNYTDLFSVWPFWTYLRNTLIITL